MEVENHPANPGDQQKIMPYGTEHNALGVLCAPIDAALEGSGLFLSQEEIIKRQSRRCAEAMQAAITPLVETIGLVEQASKAATYNAIADLLEKAAVPMSQAMEFAYDWELRAFKLHQYARRYGGSDALLRATQQMLYVASDKCAGMELTNSALNKHAIMADAGDLANYSLALAHASLLELLRDMLRALQRADEND